MNITLIGNSVLRQAIQRNFVSFPSQIPVFLRRTDDTPAPADKEERIIQLYFVRNWQVRNICDRFRLGKSRVHKIITAWRIRAVAGGYIQDIDPESLDLLISACEARGREEPWAERAMVAEASGKATQSDDHADIGPPESAWEVWASVKSEPAAAARGA